MELLKAIKQAGIQAVEQGVPAGVLLGLVKQVNPIIITVEQHLDIPAEFLLLTDNVRDYQVELSFDNPDIKQVFTTWDMVEQTESELKKIAFKSITKHEITVYNGLKAGEQVILIRAQGGQRFIVLNRVVNA